MTACTDLTSSKSYIVIYLYIICKYKDFLCTSVLLKFTMRRLKVHGTSISKLYRQIKIVDFSKFNNSLYCIWNGMNGSVSSLLRNDTIFYCLIETH